MGRGKLQARAEQGVGAKRAVIFAAVLWRMFGVRVGARTGAHHATGHFRQTDLFEVVRVRLVQESDCVVEARQMLADGGLGFF